MTPTVDSPLPDHIGRYRLLGRLGSGGMGTVYRAHDPHLDRVVALKVPTLDGPAEQRAGRVQRFQREARAAARILHPNVCPIFDVGEHDGAAFVVMAFVDGQSLAQVMAQRGPFPVHEAVALIRQLLDALAAVHAHGIIHRDVKPGNILLDVAGRPILTDFGLARPEEAGEGLTSEGAVIGTPAYMAPEQAAGQAAQVGPWTDLYAVGVVLYQMLTGRLPFEGPAAAVLGAVVRDEPPAPRQFRPDLSPTLELVVLKALRKSPHERFTNARDFGAALAGVAIAPAVDRSTTVVLPAEQPASRPEPASWHRWLTRRLSWLPGAFVIAGAGALLGLMVLLFFLQKNDSMTGRIVPGILVSLVFLVPSMLGGLGLWTLAELSRRAEGVRTAAAKGWTWCIHAAARNGVPLGMADEMGETPLMHAAANGHTEVVKVLLLQGVAINAVSSLGQTAIEIAYARGHAHIVALLQKEARPPQPAVTVPGRPPSARRWLLGSALLGAAVVVWYNWVYSPWPQQIGFDELVRLLKAKEVKSIQNHWRIVEGEVKDPGHHPNLADGRFSAEIPENINIATTLANTDPSLRLPQMSGGPRYCPPPRWSIVLILGIPAAVAGLLGWPLGATYWFPLLRSRRRD